MAIDHIAPKEAAELLGEALKRRPTAEDLTSHNILHSMPGVSSALQETSLALDRRIKEDKLNKKLENRPDSDDLINKGIMKDSKVAPALQQHRVELEMEMKKNNLDQQLAIRPDVNALYDKGILKENFACAESA